MKDRERLEKIKAHQQGTRFDLGSLAKDVDWLISKLEEAWAENDNLRVAYEATELVLHRAGEILGEEINKTGEILLEGKETSHEA